MEYLDPRVTCTIPAIVFLAASIEVGKRSCWEHANNSVYGAFQKAVYAPMPATKLTSTTKKVMELNALPARSDSSASAAAQGLQGRQRDARSLQGGVGSPSTARSWH